MKDLEQRLAHAQATEAMEKTYERAGNLTLAADSLEWLAGIVGDSPILKRDLLTALSAKGHELEPVDAKSWVMELSRVTKAVADQEVRIGELLDQRSIDALKD
ncbi:MAG: hypothetical protein QFB86_03810 [Patescibacteria group bacterium]|nr:hypothetical protein [Patescibacteria group bacterium]